MSQKNIKDMTLEELKCFVLERKIIIVENVKLFSTFFHDLIQQYENWIKTNNTNDMRQCAYDIKNTSEHAEWSYNKLLINKTINSRPFTIPKRGEIWTCQFGMNIGSEENKVRPVVIVQNDTGNEKGPTTIVIPISNRPAKISTHISLKNSDYFLVEGEKDEITGTILCEQIRVISKVRLGRHIGNLDNEFVNKILYTKLKKSLDL